MMKERYFGDDLQRTSYIARFVQEAVKKDGKGPYPPNSDNCVATALSMETLNCSVASLPCTRLVHRLASLRLAP